MCAKAFCVKGIYGSGMVLQRETVNCIFGSGKSAAVVKLNFRGKAYSSVVDEKGNWKIEFDSLEAGGPFEICLECENEKIIFSDVFVGEVWVSSGQSNAQLPMERMKFSYPEEFAAQKNDFVRMITIPISWSFEGEQDSVENPTWICASSETIGQMSGTAYFFAKKLSDELKMPVGIVNASQGGSPISAWMSKESLEELNKTDYLSTLKYYENPENVKKTQESVAEKQKCWDESINSTDLGQKEGWEKLEYCDIEKDWKDCTVPGYIHDFDSAGFVWVKKEICLTKSEVEHIEEKGGWIWLGTILDADKVWINGKEVGITYYCYPPRRYELLQGILKEGKNTITVRLQKNSKIGKICFYEEKPYYLFSKDVTIHPVAVRNVELPEEKISIPKDGVCISLAGNWKMKIGTKVEDGPENMFFEWCPTALYNSMLAPAFKYAVAGALWYQGESDAPKYAEYSDMLKKMIDLWREKFVYAKKDMPFVIVQLPNWSDGKDEDSAVVFSDWALQREAQKDAVKNSKNAAISIAIDAGEWNDLHPEKKKTTGTRAGMQALRIGYGKAYKPAPEFNSYKLEKDSCFITFENFGSALKACKVVGKAANLKETDKIVCGFSVLYNKNGKEECSEVCAELVSETEVKVDLSSIKETVKEIRFLWAQSPAPVNLYNQDNLPAEPFRIKI